MKIGINDKALNRIISLQGKASTKLADYTKGTKPFAQKQMSSEEITWALRNTSEEDRMTLIQEYGADAMNKLLYKSIMADNRRQRNG
jgi:hypothetical protein